MKEFSHRQKIIIVALIIILITSAHYTMSHAVVYLHDISRRMYYLPIILASYWFGKKGGIYSAASITILYFPHALFSWYGRNPRYLDNMIEIVFFNIVGYMIGTYIERKNDQKKSAEQSARELQEAYSLLQNNTEKIIQLEDELRFADRLSILGELSASLAHEVRNPLGSIQGATEILQKKISENEPEYEFIKIQLDEIQRLDKVVENYLSLTQRDQKTFRKVNLIDLVSNSMALVRVSAGSRNVSLTTKFPDEKQIFVDGDPVQIQQALLNVALNANYAVSEGGTLLCEILLDKDNQHADVVITDSGPGIVKEIEEKIFDPFFSTKEDGTGLGLAIVKRIMTQHGGNVWFNNHKDGASFFLRFPIRQPE
ncbi:MAG: PAS domain-containing sensor histidine kinase [Calditrichaceae bacterium]